MANEPKMNFGELPSESDNIKPGIHDMVIVSATKQLSQKGKPMLVLVVSPKAAKGIKIYDRYTLFDENYKPESFGQYKLKKLLEAVDYIPKGEFTIELLAGMLPEMEFSVRLDHEEGSDGKTYLGIKDVESYAPVGTVGEPREEKEKEVSPESFMKKEDKDVSAKVIAELEDDDDTV